MSDYLKLVVMKLLKLFLIGLLFIAYGCNEDVFDTEPQVENVELKKSEIKMVPISGEAMVTIDEYNEQGFGIGGTLSGFFTHLGQLDESKCSWENISRTFSPPMVYYTHNIILCAANGDYVYATYDGTLNFQTLEASATMIFEGGTGRFKNVSGQMEAKGYPEIDELGRIFRSYIVGEGEISNVGSSK